ncbi:SpoIIE family protein phosphatase [Streptomyces litmocidini]|uniref:SpoIIE family protein phosphatase n=1 Tax=Streptomyces litmocidini TaxID=67318 RepID=UPI001E4AED03|nr:SpoIIE family protein phosphatase [Streptomyces litmocidini]
MAKPWRSAARLPPGETLVLHTDGAEEPRDRRGRFFALDAAPAGVTGGAPASLVRRVHEELLRPTGGRLADDIALLVVRNDRVRMPAQPAEPGLRRPRPAPSSHR